MRSHYFGFIVHTHFLYEAELSCSLQHAYDVSVQMIRQLEGITSRLAETTVFSGQQYAVGLENWLNDFSPDVEQVAARVLHQYRTADEMLRMRKLQEALDWRWLKFQETAVVVQLSLAQTIQQTVHLMMTVGWNEGAAEDDVSFSSEFVQLYFAYFHRLGIPCEWRLAFPQQTEVTRQPHPYGIRLDTMEKLEALRKMRADACKRGEVKLTRTDGCDLAGITLKTVKKYDKLLYERWYDASYLTN